MEADGLDGLIADLTKAGVTAGVKTLAVFDQAGKRMRDDARRLAPKRGLPHYAAKITHETTIDGQVVTVEVGPERGGQGNLGGILEDGTSRTPPHAHLGPALDMEGPRAVKRLGEVLGDL